jgi:hypothetical protein
MAEFKGKGLKVRCIDCAKLVDGKCSVKGALVSSKKKRLCASYDFKGEYENRTPAAAIYSPYMDRKTRKRINRLINMGITPVSAPLDAENPEGYEKVKTLSMPRSTATATHLGEVPVEDGLVQRVEQEDGKLIWTPNDAV